MKFSWDWLRDTIYDPVRDSAKNVEVQARAEHVFTTYYRQHIVRHDPLFMIKLSTEGSWTDKIAAMSNRYGLPVPANADMGMDTHVFERIRDVLVEIESNRSRTVVCGANPSKGYAR